MNDQPIRGALNEEQLQRQIHFWLNLVIRGVTLRNPIHMKMHGHRTTLYIQATVVLPGADMKNPKEEEKETVDIVLENTPNYSYTPASVIKIGDFKGEWPPRTLIQDSVKPAIIVPKHTQTAKILREGRL